MSTSQRFRVAFEKYCIGTTILSIKATGTFAEPKKSIIYLSDGKSIQFVRGERGLDCEDYASLVMKDAEENIIHDDVSWDGSWENTTVEITKKEAFRNGFQQAFGKKIIGAVVGRDLGLILEDNLMVLSKSEPFMSADYLLLYTETENGFQGTPVARSITMADKEHSIYPAFVFSEESKIC